MTVTDNFNFKAFETPLLIKRMLVGGGVALLLMAFFLFKVKNPNPTWGTFWMLRPLIVITIAGAMGAGCTYFMNLLTSEGGWKKILVSLLNIIGFIISLFLGFVLGLDGTLWN